MAIPGGGLGMEPLVGGLHDEIVDFDGLVVEGRGHGDVAGVWVDGEWG